MACTGQAMASPEERILLQAILKKEIGILYDKLITESAVCG